ncbi:MAG TPA: type III-A CRISPR-associated RAMP protein Csm5 [Anaerolineae bacterium]|nr:type III-A CRISPR-associated RAMP protein Csm5 [Anaerolineae bacterium]HQK14884.1 type III-A CRISPR-associated RAMP protein Csm5 [Anaerolineae bacterium]
MADYRLYQVKVSVLTPLHIGSGDVLLRDYDFKTAGQRTWVLNQDAILADAYDRAGGDMSDWNRLALLPGQPVCDDELYEGSPFVRYALAGVTSIDQVREQLKDVYDRPYLPGSSLKGALRTALGWKRWQMLGLKPDVRNLNRRREFAAQWYEQELFSEHSGKSPNKDTFRALQVADSAPVAAERLMLVNARVLNRGGTLGSPIELEAIRPDTVFETEIKIDLALFSAWAKRHHLELRGSDLLLNLPDILREYATRRLERQAAWFSQVSGAEKTAQYCRDLLKTTLPPNASFLQIGWGGGWESKTFADPLQTDRNFMESILRSPREGGYGLARGTRRPGDPFPKSRRVLVQVQRAPDGRTHETPLYPLGWVLVEMKEEK